MTKITIELVHGGFILTTPEEVLGIKAGERKEVFQSQGKLMKALRAAIDDNSLVVRGKAADDESASA